MTKYTKTLSLRQAAAEFLAAVSDAIAHRGHAVAIWSGGATPRRMVPFLTEAAIDWSVVTFILSDERWVSLDDSSSNEGEMRRYFAGTALQTATIVGIYTPGIGHHAGARAGSSRIGRLLQDPADISVLGVGDDGHTASLFPGQPWTTAPSGDWLCAASHPESGEARVSLTPFALWKSRGWLLLATTAAKRAQWDLALAGAPVAETPVAIGTDHRAPPVTVVTE